MATPDPAGRFKLIEEAVTAPGVCWVTKTDKGPFIDTGTTVAFGEFGRLYLSVAAVREMATLFDNEVSTPVEVPEKEEKTLDDELRDLAVQLARLADRIPSAADSVQPEAASTVADADASASVEVDDSVPPVFDTDGSDVAKPKQRANKSTQAAHGPDKQSNGATRNKRSADIPSGASDVNPFRI